MPLRHPIAIQVAALMLACGCGAGDIDGPSPVEGGAGAGGAGRGNDGGGGDAGDGAGPGGEAGSGQVVPSNDPPLFDDDPSAMAEPRRCSKVDFLYVVDNSASMVDKQENLARSFQGFSRIVTETLGTSDHHIMVVDTDGINAGDRLSGVDSTGNGDQCGGTLGAGRRIGGEGEDCGVAGNQRYLLDDQGNLPGTFACLAKVGIFGNVGEQPVDALLTATGAISAEVDDCNEGFVRDDAVLVVTIITDEEDEYSRGDPGFWRQRLLSVKGGNEEALVVLGLIADNHIAGGLPGGPCDEFSGSPAPRLERFVRSFGLSSIGSVCAPDYSSFFAEAVSQIDTACEDFVPVVR